MTFSQTYGAVLEPFVKNFKDAANEKGRNTVVNIAVAAVKRCKALLEDAEELPKDLRKSVTHYLKESPDNQPEPEVEDAKPKVKPKKLKQFYSLRDVIKENYRHLIDKEIPHQSGDKEYIAKFQAAVTTVLKNMSEEDLEEAEEIVEEWNTEGAPSDIQLKRARTKLPKEIQKKVEEWKFTSGALVMCLVSYWDGEHVRAFHLENTPSTGNCFTQACPDWRAGTFDQFKTWSHKQLAAKELDSDDEEEIPVNFQKAKDIQFDTNEVGQFILPWLHNYRTVRQKQRVVRGYIGAVYRRFTGSKIAAFPYSLASKDQQTIYDQECVPQGFILSDPDHLNGFKIELLYNHWLERQRQKLSPFVVLNPGPHHQAAEAKSEKAKGKRKMPYEEISSDDGDVGSKEEDDRSQDETEEVIPPLLKVGQPTGMIAGSSKLPPKGQSRTSGKSKKRKAEGALDTDEHEFGEEVIPPLLKVGPPKGKIAGLSKLPTKGQTQKSAKEGRSNKRKAEAILDAGPAKSLKRDGGGKSRLTDRPANDRGKRERDASNDDELPSLDHKGKSARKGEKPLVEDHVGATVTGKKRKGGFEDKELTSPKRTRVNADVQPKKRSGKPTRQRSTSPPANAEKLQLEPLSPPVRVRVSGRVREFPAGNLTTGGSRVAFLRSLCSLPKFRALVDLIVPMPKASPIPDNYPKWASWSSREVYLPAGFHSGKSFKKALSILNEALNNSSVMEDGTIDAPLLLLGLTFREVARAMEIEDGEQTEYPQQLLDSPLGIQEMQKIEEMLNSVIIP